MGKLILVQQLLGLEQVRILSGDDEAVPARSGIPGLVQL
jgi:hypothetical protein